MPAPSPFDPLSRLDPGDPTHPSWPADTTRWSVEPPHPFDLVEWEIAG